MARESSLVAITYTHFSHQCCMDHTGSLMVQLEENLVLDGAMQGPESGRELSGALSVPLDHYSGICMVLPASFRVGHSQ